jgi:hypothetical protein
VYSSFVTTVQFVAKSRLLPQFQNPVNHLCPNSIKVAVDIQGVQPLPGTASASFAFGNPALSMASSTVFYS